MLKKWWNFQIFMKIRNKNSWIWKFIFEELPMKEISRVVINEVICYTSSRRKPGWRFTAGSTYWCKRNRRPKSTEFIYDMGLFEDVFDDRNHHDMKMCHLESILHVLKFHFDWVWAPGDNVNEISIWLQFFDRGDFLRFSARKFWNFRILKFYLFRKAVSWFV